MKILIFNWRDIKNPEAGGAEIHLHEIFKRIVKKGHEAVLISSKFDNCKNSEIIDGINIIRIGNKFNFNFVAVLYYLKSLRNEKFDVVVDDISKIPLCTPLYIKKPLIGIIHHIHGDTLFKELPFIMASYIWLSERILIPLIYKNIDLVAVSSSTKKEIVGLGIDKKNIRLIYNGINGQFAPDWSKKKDNLVVYVGRIKRYKQLDHLVRAFQIVKNRMSNSELIIAGIGNFSEIRQLSEKLNLKLSLYNEITENEKLDIMQRARVFVTPSMKEGWGITTIEANRCGTPVIAYNVPGLRDSVKDNETGLLVKFGDIKGLADAIIKIIEDNDFCEQLSKNAFEWSLKFDWGKSAEELLSLIKEESLL